MSRLVLILTLKRFNLKLRYFNVHCREKPYRNLKSTKRQTMKFKSAKLHCECFTYLTSFDFLCECFTYLTSFDFLLDPFCILLVFVVDVYIVCFIYSRLSLSRSRRDPLKHFEISVLRHIRFAELRKIQIEQQNFTNEHVI